VGTATIARLAATDDPSCRVCGAGTSPLGPVHGDYSDRDYQLRRCEVCRYAFIADPWTDFDRIYDDRYYSGQGADPLVDYRFELDQPRRTIRQYEWRGITRRVERLLGGLDRVRWLDFGCGNGGLVRYALSNSAASAYGFEEGSIAASAQAVGVPMLSADALATETESFDVVTAIEVLEHTIDPIAELQAIRRLLRPGGLLFLTTGNAAPFAEHLTAWSYVVPEIHVSFFEPTTLEYALRKSGFRPARVAADDGFDEILKFKVLKNLRVRRRNLLTDAIPAGPLAAVAERKVRLSEHPVGWAE
jgi:2-polyprenyl-3-methyl-5-hydroxy-6-metoxy-1,4-benzoquinol methylase